MRTLPLKSDWLKIITFNQVSFLPPKLIYGKRLFTWSTQYKNTWLQSFCAFHIFSLVCIYLVIYVKFDKDHKTSELND